MLKPLAERRGLNTWEKIVAFTGDEWFPSRLPFGKFKGRLYQEAGELAGELLSSKKRTGGNREHGGRCWPRVPPGFLSVGLCLPRFPLGG
jgi:hypothetical protein